ncbi:MAG: hypothetical protein LAQ69_43845 [Acidobacteriia bacterium]|nr:hypothetical protein [Terriglobia bacterium]
MNDDERLEFCQNLAYLTQEHPESNQYISVAEMEIYLRRLHSDRPAHEGFDLFVKDAHLSMFLERDANSDGFRFSHEPILEFFLGRLIAHDLIAKRFDRIAPRRCHAADL